MNTELKIFLVIVVIIYSFIGYRIYMESNQNTQVRESNIVNQDIETKQCSKQTTRSKNITREYFDGHYYIVFSPNYYKMGVIHDPDCPCNK